MQKKITRFSTAAVLPTPLARCGAERPQREGAIKAALLVPAPRFLGHEMNHTRFFC